MKFTLERHHALAAIGRVTGVVSRNSNVPILNNVAIVAEKDRIVFRATDLDMEATATCTANVTTEGRTTVDADKLRQIIAAAAQGSEISFELGGEDDPRLFVKSGRSKFRLPVIEYDVFPTIPDDKWQSTFDMPGDVLADMLSRSVFAASTDASRPALVGVHLKNDGDEMIAVGCSGFRFALVREATQDKDMPAVTIPSKMVAQVVKLSSDAPTVSVAVSDNKVRVSDGDASLTGKVIDYPYLDYARGIPTEWPHEASVNKDAFAAGVRRALIAGETDKSGVGIKLTFANDVLTITGRNSAEDAVDEIECSYQGPEISLGITAAYALDAVANVTGDTVVIGVGEDIPVTVFRSVDDDGAVNTAVKRMVH